MAVLGLAVGVFGRRLRALGVEPGVLMLVVVAVRLVFADLLRLLPVGGLFLVKLGLYEHGQLNGLVADAVTLLAHLVGELKGIHLVASTWPFHAVGATAETVAPQSVLALEEHGGVAVVHCLGRVDGIVLEQALVGSGKGHRGDEMNECQTHCKVASEGVNKIDGVVMSEKAERGRLEGRRGLHMRL
ncbi:uncharacterized protein F5Z01DRAFT_655723, partial [Emericellopsis atlantica]